MRNILLDPQAIDDLKWWISHEKRIALKIIELIEELPSSPFTGKGRPEMLRFNLSGFWSRRITQEHRLIYEVTEQYIRVVIIIVKKAIAPSQKAIALLVTKLNLKGDRLHP